MPAVLIALCLVWTGCAGPRAPASLPPQAGAQGPWQERVKAPAPLQAALRQGRLHTIASAAGAPIPVRIYGEHGPRTPVVMTHGLQSHSGWFAQSAAHLAGMGHPVYAFDRRGAGLSAAPRGDMKDYREMVADIRTVADFVEDQHGVGPFFLLGHCFGAIPATVFACKYPERLKGLILTTPAIYTQTSLPLSQSLKIFLTPSGRRNYLVPSPLDPSWFSELAEYEAFIRSDDLALQHATGDFYYQVHRARKFIYRNTARLTIPVFLAIAGQDPICDNRRNIAFFEKLPADDKMLINYEDARHVLEFSVEKKRFLRDLGYWLKRETEG